MAEQQINVGVNTQGAQQDLQQLANDINNFLKTQALAAGKTPRLLDLTADIEALKELKNQFQEVINSQPTIRGPLNNAGQGGANRPLTPSQINLGGVASTPQDQAKFLERVMTRLMTHHLSNSANPINTGLSYSDLTGRTGPAPGQAQPQPPAQPVPRQPDSPIGGIARHLGGQALSGGAGGALGSAAGAAMQGAAGGLAGLGVVGGGLLGLAGYGVFKAASTMNEGLDKAKSEAVEIDKFKRQLGDVGVDFDSLRDHVREAAVGMGLSFEQAGKMAQILSRDSRSQIRNEQEIGSETKNAAAVARATGIDGDQIASFFAQMRAARTTDTVQDSRKMSLMIADAIKRSGDPLNADKMLQAMASFAERTRDQSLGRVNVGAYGGMLSGLMGAGVGSGTASSIINTFDQSTRNGGGSEASEALIFQALGGNQIGAGNAMKLRQAGMYASTNSVFADKKSPFYDKGFGGGSDTMNVTRYMQEMDRQFPGSDRQSQDTKLASMAQFFGGNWAHAQQFTSTYQKHGAAGLDATSKMLSNYGIDPAAINMTGLTQLAGIANAGGLDGLQEQRGLMAGRTDLTKEQKSALASLEVSKDPEVLRRGLADIAKTLDSELSDGKAIKDASVNMDQNIQKLATGLIPASVLTNELLGGLVEKMAPDSDIAKRIRAESEMSSTVEASQPGAAPELVGKANGFAKRDGDKYLKEIFNVEEQLGMPPGSLAAIALKEGGFNPNHTSGTGIGKDGQKYTTPAKGMFQMLPASISDSTPEFKKRFGRGPNMDSAVDQMWMGGIYANMKIKEAGGDPVKGYRYFHGGRGFNEAKSPISTKQLDQSTSEYASMLNGLSRSAKIYRMDPDAFDVGASGGIPARVAKIPTGNPERAAVAASQAIQVGVDISASKPMRVLDKHGNDALDPVFFTATAGKPKASGANMGQK